MSKHTYRTRVSRRSRPSARVSSGGRRGGAESSAAGAEASCPEAGAVPTGAAFTCSRSLSLLAALSPSFRRSETTEILSSRSSRSPLVDSLDSKVESRVAGGRLPVRQPERSSPLQSQDRQQTSQPSCVLTWHRCRGYDRSCREQGNAAPDCGKRTRGSSTVPES